MTHVKRVPLSLFVLVLVWGISSLAQQAATPPSPGACAMPAVANAPNEPNIFTEEQEEWLGDIMDQEIRRQFSVIEDPDGYLQTLGERLVAQLPPTRVRYHFVIIDTPVVNAFGLAGGRIYIHRSMIAFMKNEDEMAALVGHEIGHMAAHQVAIHISGWFRELGITQVGDRQDLVRKWNQFKDNAAKIKRISNERREQQEQLIADRISLYAMIRAGYDPAYFATFADRSFETKGKMGGFWSDFFGTTRPESKRLREIVRNAEPVAKACIASANADRTLFAKWQQAVIVAKRVVAHEALPGLERKLALHPRLRGDLRIIRFSPDGNHLLAQDDSSIFVLTREPLGYLFRVDALDARPAHFTPDSRALVFYDKELRVERWDLASGQRTSVHQIATPRPCMQSRLSPSGEVLVCVTPDFELQLIDVSTGTPFFSRKKFYELTAFDFFLRLLLEILEDETFELFHMQFSADGHYFAMGYSNSSFAYDLQTRAEIKLPGRLKQAVASTFTFAGDGQIACYEFKGRQKKIVTIRFPSGDVVDQFDSQTRGELAVPVKGNYMILWHAGTVPVLVLDLATKKIVSGYKVEGYDLYDKWFAGETTGGEVALVSMEDKKTLGKVQLPDSPLETPKAATFSNNGKWLAVSGKTRGAVWNMETGERVFHTLGFEGGFFDQDRFIGEFPKREKDPAMVFQFDPANRESHELYKLDTDQATDGADESLTRFSSSRTRPMGELTVMVEPRDKKKPYSGGFVMTINDARTGKKLWDREVHRGRPALFYSKAGNTLTMLVGNYDTIKAEAKQDPSLNEKLNAIQGRKGKEDSYLLLCFHARTGNNLGAVLVDTGNLSFRVRRATTTGDTVLVGDSNHRTLVYSLKSGEQKGKVFGEPLATSKRGDLMLIENGAGEVDLYDISTLQSLAHYSFPARIAHAEFSPDGLSVFVLTVDQSVYQLKRPGGTQSADSH